MEKKVNVEVSKVKKLVKEVKYMSKRRVIWMEKNVKWTESIRVVRIVTRDSGRK